MNSHCILMVSYKHRLIFWGVVGYSANFSFRQNPEKVDELVEGVIEVAKQKYSELFERIVDITKEAGGTEQDLTYITYFPDLWK